jgi:putative transposase
LLIENLRRRGGGGARVGRSWEVDEACIKVHGRWYYLYRAISRCGALVDVMLSEKRDMDVANILAVPQARAMAATRRCNVVTAHPS